MMDSSGRLLFTSPLKSFNSATLMCSESPSYFDIRELFVRHRIRQTWWGRINKVLSENTKTGTVAVKVGASHRWPQPSFNCDISTSIEADSRKLAPSINVKQRTLISGDADELQSIYTSFGRLGAG